MSLLAACAVVRREASVPTACTAADLISQDPGCPRGTSTCTVTRRFAAGDKCVLDLGARAVTIAAGGVLNVESGSATVRAASFTIAAGGFVGDRAGVAAPVPSVGGKITIETTGAVDVQRDANANGIINGIIDVGGSTRGGAVVIRAGGSLVVSGEIVADGIAAAGTGGSLTVHAGDNISSDPGSLVSALAGSQSYFGGGYISLTAGGKIELNDRVDASGSTGGDIVLAATRDVRVSRLLSNGIGDAGDGGTVGITAGTSAQVAGAGVISASSLSSSALAGDGGLVTITAEHGSVSILAASHIRAEAGGADSDGGDIDIDAEGGITIEAGDERNPPVLSVRNNATHSGIGGGGNIAVQASRSFGSAAALDGSGNWSGGDITVTSEGDLTLNGPLAANGRTADAYGGTVTLEAGRSGAGSLSVQSTIDVSGGAASGTGGRTALSGCDLAVAGSGSILAGAATAGENDLTAREQLKIERRARINATRTVKSGTNGKNVLTYPSRKPPILARGVMTPAAVMTGLATCAVAGEAHCLISCPAWIGGIARRGAAQGVRQICGSCRSALPARPEALEG